VNVPPKIFFDRGGVQSGPQLSPDAAYVVYHSNESGRDEVYVRPFPTGAGQWQVSLGGGSDPHWSPKGETLWFRGFGNVLKEAHVKLGTTITISKPRDVFKGDPIGVNQTLGYALLGERFIAARPGRS